MKANRKSDGERQKKREKFTQPTSGGHGRFIAAIAATVLLLVVVLQIFRPTRPAVAPSDPAPVVPTVSRGAAEVRIPLSELAGGQVRFAEHTSASGGRAIRFLALKGADGQYRAALDACEICYHTGRGYYQNGDELVCRQCGNSYAPALIDESPGGCHPVALPRRVEGDHLVISTSDVESADVRTAAKAPSPRR